MNFQSFKGVTSHFETPHCEAMSVFQSTLLKLTAKTPERSCLSKGKGSSPKHHFSVGGVVLGSHMDSGGPLMSQRRRKCHTGL